MTTTVPVSTRAQTASFQQIAGIAGLLTIVVGITQLVAVGNTPGLGDSAAKVAAYFADNSAAHRYGVAVSALLGIPIAIFFIGVYRTLADADRAHDASWATLFLYGTIMMSATAGLGEGLYAIPVLRNGEGLTPDMLRAINDGSAIARASLGVWIAVALGGVAAATFQYGIRARWYGWLCTIGALLGVLAVIDSVSAGPNGAFADLAFFFVIVWTLATSILMLRDRVRQ